LTNTTSHYISLPGYTTAERKPSMAVTFPGGDEMPVFILMQCIRDYRKALILSEHYLGTTKNVTTL
jgi:hypothetical protein